MDEIFLYNSPLGVLQIKGSGDAISMISFFHEKDETVQVAAVPGKMPVSPVVKECARQLDAYFAGRLKHFDLKLNQEGTSFQQKVWDELLKTGYGRTATYLQLSKAIGNVKAIRAVGTANGRNNIAIVVPCHRVIGSNGSLVGYAGGLWRKKWLLEHEAKYANGVQQLF